jgi:hypothetical protein
VLAGCGTADDRDEARAVTQRFYDAVRADDGAAACQELSQALAEEEGDRCERDVKQLETSRITGVEVFVTSAKVDTADAGSAFLNRGPSGWKIAAVGCAPGGKPASHPFDCELED